MASFFDRFFSRRTQTKNRRPVALSKARPHFEALEDRLTPATLPQPVVDNVRSFMTGASSPQIAVDPLDSQRLVAVASTGTGLAGAYSLNGGVSWSAFIAPTTFRDPNLTFNGAAPFASNFAAVTDPSVTFDRTGRFYVAASYHDAAYNSGAIKVSRFDVQSGPPSLDHESIVYRWLGVDPAYNPVVAVDTNEVAWTDPQTGSLYTDDLANSVVVNNTTRVQGQASTPYTDIVPRGVYVAWNARLQQRTETPPNPPDQFGPVESRIMIAGSGDGARTFSSPQFVSGSVNAANPVISFEAPSAVNAASRMLIFFNSSAFVPSTGNPTGSDPAATNLVVDRSFPTQGINDGNVVVAAQEFKNNATVFINDAQQNFPGGNRQLPDTPSTPTTSSIDVTLDSAGMTGVNDVDVTINIDHPDIGQLLIELVAPDGTSITLVQPRIDGSDAALNPAQGLTGTSLGVTQNNIQGQTPQSVGTVFDSDADRRINEGVGAFIGRFKPEAGNLATIYNRPLSFYNGTWKLRVTDYFSSATNNQNSIGAIRGWSIDFTNRINRNGFGFENNIATTTAASFNQTGAALTAAGAPGIGSGLSVAVDRSFGDYSPYYGRMYVAYNFNGDVFVKYSDNGFTWSSGTKLNDDKVSDNFSEGNRPQFLPTLAVDPRTGTLVATYYDARWDAAQKRVTTMFTTSIDGGATFAASKYLNPDKTAIDVITGSTVVMEPTPGDASTAGVEGFGDRQGLAAYNGHVFAFWSSNLASGASNVYTADISISSGPRVVTGSMGPILDEQASYVSQDGTVTGSVVFNPTVSTLRDEIRKLSYTGTVSGGAFTLVFRGQSTSIPYDSTAQQIENQLGALSTVGAGNVKVYGTTGDWIIAFRNVLGSADIVDADFTATSQLTGTTPGVVLSNGNVQGTRALTGFIVTFDRRIDPASFDASDIELYYRSPSVPGSSMGTSLFSNAVQTLSMTGTPTAGTFTLSYNGNSTTALPYNATTAQVLAALEKLPGIGIGNLQVTGVDGQSYVVAFTGDLAHKSVATLVADNTNLIGGTLQVQVTNQGSSAVFNIRPLDLNTGLLGLKTYGATQFLVEVVPQTLVGTYSYVVGTNVRDLMRRRDSSIDPSTLTYQTFTGTNGAVAGATGGFNSTPGYTEFTLSASGLTDSVVDLNAYIVGSGLDNVDIYLQAPDKRLVPLVLDQPVSAPGPGGITFDDQAIFYPDQKPTFSTFKAIGALSNFNGLGSSLDGTWKLIVIKSTSGAATISDWGIKVATQSTFSASSVINVGNYVDQNQDTFQRETDFSLTQILQLTGNPTGGTFRLIYGSESTVDLPYSATALDISNALGNLPSMGANDVTVTARLSGGFDITFSEALAQRSAFKLRVYNALTGGTTPQVSITTSPGKWDVFAAPTPNQSENPYFPSFDSHSAPLSIPGAHVVTSPTYEGRTTDFNGNQIRDNGITYSTISVPDDGSGTVISDLDVQISLDHLKSTDLILTLIAPDGTQVQLAKQDGAGFAFFGIPTGQFASVNFDSQSSNSVQSNLGGAVSGTFSPRGSLDVLRGKKLAGVWTLKIEDVVAGGNGASVLNRWAIVPRTAVYLNSTAKFVDVSFDRDIDVSSFTNSSVVELTGPTGSIAGPFIVAANPPGTPAGQENRRFRITFQQPQAVQGWYSLVLSSAIKDTAGNPLDNNLNAGLDALRSADPASTTIASWSVKTYPGATSVPTASPIAAAPANQTTTVESLITVPDNFVIQRDASHRIQIQINVTHARVADLDVSLVAPDGTVIRLSLGSDLFTGNPNNLANFTGTVFDDAIRLPGATADTIPIQLGSAPYAPQAGLAYRPVDSLFQLVGKNAGGDWKLRVVNHGTSAGSIDSWSLKLPQAIPGTGLGETSADRATIPFRIFVGSPSNALTSQVWTGIGPFLSENQSGAGSVRTLAVDPSDPSGNTVFAGAADGGVWKTTNFLTNNPAGPVWQSLIDDAPTTGLRISYITVIGRNNNVDQSIVIVGTGDNQNFRGGVGFFRSEDGGKTWSVIGNLLDGKVKDSNGTNLSLVGAKFHKIVYDSVPLPPNGSGVREYIMYAAVEGSFGLNNGGIYRSTDTGKTWTRVRAGTATDLALIPTGLKDTNGNSLNLWAAFAGEGLFLTNSAVDTTNLGSVVNGGLGVANRVAYNSVTNNYDPLPVLNNSVDFTGTSYIQIASPPANAANDLGNTLYSGWLYVAVSNSGAKNGLYVTKDFGRNWTKVVIPETVTVPQFNSNPTNNESGPQLSIFNSLNKVVVDPVNPNIVYVFDRNYSIRIDITKMADAYAAVSNDYSDPAPNVAGPLTAGQLDVHPTVFGDPNGDYLNLLRHPDTALSPQSSSTLIFTKYANAQFTNDGTDISWNYFGPSFGTNPGQVSMQVDPTTGERRIFVANDSGISTYVVKPDGSTISTQGMASIANGARNGNMQIRSVIGGSVTPSVTGARTSNQLTTSSTNGAGFASGSATPGDLMQSGNLISNSISEAAYYPLLDGSGDYYSYFSPSRLNIGADFFQYVDKVVTQQYYVRTSGLLQPGESPPSANWTNYNYFSNDYYSPGFEQHTMPRPVAQNVYDGSAVLIGSASGSVYRSSGNSLQGKGLSWVAVANQGDLSGASGVTAVAFGAPAVGNANLNNFMYAATTNNKVFVTFTGGGYNGSTQWRDITSNLAAVGKQVLQIVPSPTRGSREVYVLTSQGAYYLADSQAAALNWVPLTGNLFSLTRKVLGGALPNETAVKYLTSLAVDWRYAIPDNLAAPNGPTHPVIYVAGEGGVFRSIDKGTTWSFYPDNTSVVGAPDRGLFPSVLVTDLSIAVGGVNYANGFPDQSTAENVLVANTMGRGDFIIRLNNSDVEQYNVIPHKGPMVTGMTAINPDPGNTVTGFDITFDKAVDPGTFDVSSFLYAKDPNGQAISIASVTGVNPVANGDKVYRVIFTTPQLLSGAYAFRLKTSISDFSGNKLNSDNDNVNGEVPADEFVGTLTVQLNRAPSFSAIADVITQPNVATTPFTFTVTDPDPGSGVTVTVTNSSNTALAPLANIALTPLGGGIYRIVITPATNQYGTSVITLTATDGRGLSTAKNFNLIVDTAPAFTFASDPLVTPHRPLTRTDTITFSDAEQDTVTFGTPTIAAAGPAATLQTQFQFFTTGNNFFSLYGQNEKWFKSQTNGAWYFITPDGKIRRDGGSFGASTLVPTTLTYAYWNDNNLIFTALTPPSIIATVQNVVQANGNGTADLVIDNTAAPNFVGSVAITVPYSDGFLQRTKTLTVTFTNVAPSVPAVGPQSSSHLTGSLSVPMQITDAESDPIIFTGNALDALAYRLDTRYDFFFTGNAYQNNNGLNEKWFRSLTQNQWFYITPAGYVYRGGAANPFVQLDVSFWTTPTKLFNASQSTTSFIDIQSNEDPARLDRQYDFYFTGNYSLNFYGQNEKWFRSAIDNAWFFILPTGEVRKDGGTFAASTIVPASLDSSYWFNPGKLINGSTLAPPAISANYSDPNLALAWDASAVSGKALVSVFASDGIAGTSQSFALDVTNAIPTLAPIADRTGANAVSHNAGTIQIPLTVSDADINGLAPDDTLTYTVTFSPGDAYDLDQQLQFVKSGGSYYFNNSGQNEKWVYSQTNSAWYTLLPNGDLKVAVGTPAQWMFVKNLGTAVYDDPTLLHEATNTPLPAGLANFVGSVTGAYPNPNLNITIPSQFVGTAKVTVKVSDGVGGTATQSFLLESADANAPVINVVPAGPHTVNNGNTLSLNVNAFDADGDVTTVTVEAVGHLGVVLQNQYQLSFSGSYAFNSNGFNEKWLRSGTTASGWVYFKPDGSIWQWGKTVADTLLTTVDRVFYDDPRLLTSPVAKQGLAYELDRLGTLTYYPQYDNFNNLNARWFLSSSNLWYYVLPNGDFVRSGVGTLTTLPTSFHTTPLSLQNAYGAANPVQFNATLTGGTQLDVTPTAGYLGDIWVLLKATDGNKVTYQTVKVTSV